MFFFALLESSEKAPRRSRSTHKTVLKQAEKREENRKEEKRRVRAEESFRKNLDDKNYGKDKIFFAMRTGSCTVQSEGRDDYELSDSYANVGLSSFQEFGRNKVFVDNCVVEWLMKDLAQRLNKRIVVVPQDSWETLSSWCKKSQ